MAKPTTILYRVAGIALLLFALAHTFGFSQSDPGWHVDAVRASMQNTHFDVMGSSRSYWDMFLAAGFSVGTLYVFCAILSWQLAALPAEALARLRVIRWSFALCFVVLTMLSREFLFVIPVVFSGVITICLLAAAAMSTT